MVHLVNYGSPIDMDIQTRVQGHYTSATLLRPEAPPLKLPAVGFGIGTGGGAHAPNEWYLIDSKDPKKIAGLDEATMFYVDYLYELAETAKAAR